MKRRVVQDENDGMPLKTGQTETATMARGTSQVGNIVSNNPKIESMDAKKVVCTTEQLVAKEMPLLVADSVDDTMQCAYEKLGTGVHSVVDNFFEQIFSDLSRWEVMEEVLDNHIAKYFYTSDTAKKIGDSYYPQMPSWLRSPFSYYIVAAEPSPQSTL